MNPLQKYLSSIKTPSYSMFNSPTKTTTPFTATPFTATSSTAKTTVPNSPSAVNPAPSPITPATSTTATPARSAYTQSLSGGSTGLSESQVRNNLSDFYAKNQPPGVMNTDVFATNSNTPAASATPAPKDAFLNAYRDYLAQYSASLKPSAEIQAANQKLAAIQSRGEERSLQGRRAVESALDDPYMLKSGAQQSAEQLRRRSESELADLAVQEGAAARTVNALTGQQTANQNQLKTLADLAKPIQIGDDYIDPTTGQIVSSKATKANEGFTLSPGESRFDANGNLIASGGSKPLTAAQEAAQIKQQEQETTAQQQATQSLSLINNLLSGDTSKITGVGQNPLNFFGATNAEAINQYNQLQGLLKLGVRGLLKGQGAVSDYEGKVLAQAASSLGRNLPNQSFNQALKNLRGVIKTNNGQVTSVTVTNPSTGEKITTDLSGSEIYQLVSEGNTVIYN